MLRLLTQVTADPTARSRKESASSATATTSRPRAEKRVTISSMPGSWPSFTPRITSPTGTPGLLPQVLTGQQGDGMDVSSRIPLGGPAAHQDHLRTIPDVAKLADLLRENRAGIVTCQAFGVAPVEHREPHPLVQPDVRAGGVLRVDGQSGCQAETCRLGHCSQMVQSRPRFLRIDMVGGNRGHTTPVVDARRKEAAEVLGEVRRGLKVHFWRQDQTGQRDRLEKLVRRTGRCAVHRGARLRNEVLHDDFLDVAVLAVAGCYRLDRLQPVVAALPDPDQHPGGERDRESSGVVQGGKAPLDRLVRRSPMGRQILACRFEHHALAGGHRPQRRELVGVQRPCVGVGQEAGLVSNQPAHLCEVVDGRPVPVAAQPLPSRGVTLLGPLPESEQRLVAAGVRPSPGDLEDFLRYEIWRGDPGRRLREGAVAAPIPAEHREGDENLGGIGDPPPV